MASLKQIVEGTLVGMYAFVAPLSTSPRVAVTPSLPANSYQQQAQEFLLRGVVRSTPNYRTGRLNPDVYRFSLKTDHGLKLLHIYGDDASKAAALIEREDTLIISFDPKLHVSHLSDPPIRYRPAFHPTDSEFEIELEQIVEINGEKVKFGRTPIP